MKKWRVSYYILVIIFSLLLANFEFRFNLIYLSLFTLLLGAIMSLAAKANGCLEGSSLWNSRMTEASREKLLERNGNTTISNHLHRYVWGTIYYSLASCLICFVIYLAKYNDVLFNCLTHLEPIVVFASKFVPAAGYYEDALSVYEMRREGIVTEAALSVGYVMSMLWFVSSARMLPFVFGIKKIIRFKVEMRSKSRWKLFRKFIGLGVGCSFVVWHSWGSIFAMEPDKILPHGTGYTHYPTHDVAFLIISLPIQFNTVFFMFIVLIYQFIVLACILCCARQTQRLDSALS